MGLCLCGAGGSDVDSSSVGGSSGRRGVGDSSESVEGIVCRSGGGGGSVVNRSGGGGLCWSS